MTFSSGPMVPGPLGCAVLALLISSGLLGEIAADDSLEQAGFREVVLLHLEAYPEMLPQDLYKLVYQAALGNEHAVPAREAARQWLDRELATLQPSDGEPLCMPLSPDGSLVRLNLRPFVERNGRPEDLLDAIMATAERFAGSPERIASYWGYLVGMSESGEIPFDPNELRELLIGMRDQRFPATRHSDTFRNAYAPAYRVALADTLPRVTDAECPVLRTTSDPGGG